MASIAIEWAMSNSPGPDPLLAPGLDEVAVLVELDDLRLAAAVPLHHVDLARRPERHVVRLVEQPQMSVGVHLSGGLPHAQHQHDASVGVHLVDHVGAHIGGPDIVLAVDAQAMRPVEQAFAQRAQVFAVRVEFHQRIGPAMQHEDVALGVDRHARRAAEGHARGQAEWVGDGNIVERRGRGRLRESGNGHQRGHQQNR